MSPSPTPTPASASIHWPIVGGAIGLCFVFIAGLMLTVVLMNRSPSKNQAGKPLLVLNTRSSLALLAENEFDEEEEPAIPTDLAPPVQQTVTRPGSGLEQQVLNAAVAIPPTRPDPWSGLPTPTAEPTPVEPQLKRPEVVCGTTVEFLSNPLLAGKLAEKEHKLMFLLHVSGDFEDPGFT